MAVPKKKSMLKKMNYKRVLLRSNFFVCKHKHIGVSLLGDGFFFSGKKGCCKYCKKAVLL